MPVIRLLFYREDDESIPLLDWMDELPKRARLKCLVRIERLKALGHEIRRPEADYLRDGIYELRASFQGVQYRMLYFFHGDAAIVVSHGLIKEKKVPPVEIERAMKRKQLFMENPLRHTYEEN
ncbi:MAG: type II toxin-antitoxin system RelE/ParE family toxin [bacterium]|nr:type II toxin-antitoxin system RelE/ParE family toxin [bacterium]